MKEMLGYCQNVGFINLNFGTCFSFFLFFLFSLNCIYWINRVQTYMYICINIDYFIIYLRIKNKVRSYINSAPLFFLFSYLAYM